MLASLSLLELRSGDLHRAERFYRVLVGDFTRERHGAGPFHISAPAGGFLLELYPLDDATPTTGVRLGFQVESLDAVWPVLLANGGDVVSAPSDSPWGRRAVLRDPDGHVIELVETGSTTS